jgi:hypothetical protein
VLTFLALSSSLQASIVAGHDYVVLSTPQRQDSDGKIQVVEFIEGGGLPDTGSTRTDYSWEVHVDGDPDEDDRPVGSADCDGAVGQPEVEQIARKEDRTRSSEDGRA